VNLVDFDEIRRMQDAHLLLIATLELEDTDAATGIKAALSRLAEAERGAIAFPNRTDLVAGPSLVRTSEWPPEYRLHLGPRAASDYWREWFSFCALWFGLERGPGFNTVHFASGCVQRAIEETLPGSSHSERREILWRLWQSRWLLESIDVAVMLTASELEEGLQQDETRLGNLRRDAGEQLQPQLSRGFGPH